MRFFISVPFDWFSIVLEVWVFIFFIGWMMWFKQISLSVIELWFGVAKKLKWFFWLVALRVSWNSSSEFIGIVKSSELLYETDNFYSVLVLF